MFYEYKNNYQIYETQRCIYNQNSLAYNWYLCFSRKFIKISNCDVPNSRCDISYDNAIFKIYVCECLMIWFYIFSFAPFIVDSTRYWKDQRRKVQVILFRIYARTFPIKSLILSEFQYFTTIKILKRSSIYIQRSQKKLFFIIIMAKFCTKWLYFLFWFVILLFIRVKWIRCCFKIHSNFSFFFTIWNFFCKFLKMNQTLRISHTFMLQDSILHLKKFPKAELIVSQP